MKQHEQLVWTPEMVKDFWDYYSQFPELYFTYKRATEIARQISPFLKTGDRILDYGCGPGYVVDKLIKQGFNVAGMDFSEATRNVVDNKFRGDTSYLGAYSLEQLRSTGMRFDAVTIIEVIEHLYDPQLDEVLQSVSSLLEPGGTAVFSTPNEEDLDKSMILSPDSNQLFHRWQHVRSWSADTLRSRLEQQGFQVLSTFTTNFSASLHTDHSKHPLKDKLAALKRKLKDKLKPARKQPHLVAIVRKA